MIAPTSTNTPAAILKIKERILISRVAQNGSNTALHDFEPISSEMICQSEFSFGFFAWIRSLISES
jgi:hypothetical protein